jgi:hypothetical protein
MTAANGSTRGVHDDRSLIDLVRVLRDDAALMLRQELWLLAMEVRESAKKLFGSGVILLAGVLGLVLALQCAIIAAAIAISIALALVMPMSVAVVLGTLSMAVLLAIGGGLSVHVALQRARRVDVVPRRAIDAAKETRQWLTENSNT